MCKHTCERSFLGPVYGFNQVSLWFGCCLFVPQHTSMKKPQIESNVVLFCGADTWRGEEAPPRRLVRRGPRAKCGFSSRSCQTLFSRSNAEAETLLCCPSPQKPALALTFWTSSSRRLATADPSEVEVTRGWSFWAFPSCFWILFILTCSPCCSFLLSPALNLCFLVLLTSDLTAHFKA